MEKIKAVIFDWGGVLIDDPRPALMQYCAEAFNVPVNIYTQTHDKFLEDFQKGLISEESFWEKICKELKKPPFLLSPAATSCDVSRSGKQESRGG